MKHNRKSIRLKGYDYTQVGRYFVTIVTRQRRHLFGKIQGGTMILNELGEIAAHEWKNTLKLRDNLSLGGYIIMPDHIHFLVHIDEQQEQKVYHKDELERRAGAVQGKHINKPGSLGAIVRGYKGAVTRQILEFVKSYTESNDRALNKICAELKGEKTIWIRNYNEAIIRSERHYNNVTQYIKNNPRKWEENLRAKLDIEEDR